VTGGQFRRSLLRGGASALGLLLALLASPRVQAEATTPAADAERQPHSESTARDEKGAADRASPAAESPPEASAEPEPPSEGKSSPAANPPSEETPPRAEQKSEAAPAQPRVKRARRLKPLDPPSEAQVAALERFQAEAGEYEQAARDYRSTLTLLVRHHYEEQRRRILESLDQGIHEQQDQLRVRRDGAIDRLEAFVGRYSGSSADPVATPDAMFRLAALYEERARADEKTPLEAGLVPAIALYRRIIDEFPSYTERAGVAYYLGHAYTDAGRLDEGQQAWRSLVCNNRYPVQMDPTDASKIALSPLPQDHEPAFWSDWYNRNPIPFDQLTAQQRDLTRAGPGIEREELSFADPYKGCQPVPQRVEPGQEPRYVAEAWWQLGNFHFDQLDAGGPYSLNRAKSAYQQSLAYKKPPIYGVALYKQAWTSFKQQRYHAAVDSFVQLLRHADQQEKETGDPGADFRAEAYSYIAGSLTYGDFEGPGPSDPNIARSDVLDLELDPLVAEDKMTVAIHRVQDPKLIPQDQKWTVDIYRALGQEFTDISQNRNAVAVLELALARFPMYREAPVLQDKVASLYDQLSRLAPDGSKMRGEYSQRALEARTMLAAYVGDTEWTHANHEDTEAIEQAESLAKKGLQRAAADHTNQARALVARAQAASTEAEQRNLLEQAINGYRMAELGWSAYLKQDPAALDSYESRFWLADAHYWALILQVTLGRTPNDGEIEAARNAAIDVRDSTEDDRYLQPAAYYLVSMSDNLLKDAYREYTDSGGARGVAPREAVQFSGGGADRKPLSEPLPIQVENAVADRDGYNESIVFEEDPQRNGPLYAFQAAEFYFVYGQFEQARERFEPMMAEYCGKNEWGYKAWEKLISMSNFESNAARSRELAEGRSCAFDEETKRAEEALRKPVRQGVAYLEARDIYDAAEKLPEGAERDGKWREAAAAYKLALDAAPDRDEAPEAAMNGAYAYKQVGEYDKAIDMYQLFISRYGSADKLAAVRDGDPEAQPPVAPDPGRYDERVKFLKMADDALASSYVLFFDYPQAAATFEKISRTEHFAEADRREAARQALTLAASLGDDSGMRRARQNLASLGASPRDLAEADFVIASAALKAWDRSSPVRGPNADARQTAEFAMKSYYDANARNPDASEFVVEAAYWVAKAKRAARDAREKEWWDNTKSAFETFRRVAPVKPDGISSALGSRQAGFAAEAAYIQLDEAIQKGFDYDTGHHRFTGTTTEVLEQYRRAAAQAQAHYDALQKVVDDYASPEWATASIGRQGSLYDSLRSALYDMRPPALVMFDRKTEALLRRAENSDSPELQEQADAVRVRVETAWREARDRELDSADQVMVDRYGNAITLARRYNVSNPAIVKAIQRLAFFTDVIGEAKLEQYTGRVPSLDYKPGLFLRLRPGLLSVPGPDAMPPSAPPALPRAEGP
jgi:tetratricopeptide (TPR) repeat protein